MRFPPVRPTGPTLSADAAFGRQADLHSTSVHRTSASASIRTAASRLIGRSGASAPQRRTTSAGEPASARWHHSPEPRESASRRPTHRPANRLPRPTRRPVHPRRRATTRSVGTGEPAPGPRGRRGQSVSKSPPLRAAPRPLASQRPRRTVRLRQPAGPLPAGASQGLHQRTGFCLETPRPSTDDRIPRRVGLLVRYRRSGRETSRPAHRLPQLHQELDRAAALGPPANRLTSRSRPEMEPPKQPPPGQSRPELHPHEPDPPKRSLPSRTQHRRRLRTLLGRSRTRSADSAETSPELVKRSKPPSSFGLGRSLVHPDPTSPKRTRTSGLAIALPGESGVGLAGDAARPCLASQTRAPRLRAVLAHPPTSVPYRKRAYGPPDPELPTSFRPTLEPTSEETDPTARRRDDDSPELPGVDLGVQGHASRPGPPLSEESDSTSPSPRSRPLDASSEERDSKRPSPEAVHHRAAPARLLLAVRACATKPRSHLRRGRNDTAALTLTPSHPLASTAPSARLRPGFRPTNPREGWQTSAPVRAFSLRTCQQSCSEQTPNGAPVPGSPPERRACFGRPRRPWLRSDPRGSLPINRDLRTPPASCPEGQRCVRRRRGHTSRRLQRGSRARCPRVSAQCLTRTCVRSALGSTAVASGEAAATRGSTTGAAPKSAPSADPAGDSRFGRPPKRWPFRRSRGGSFGCWSGQPEGWCRQRAGARPLG